MNIGMVSLFPRKFLDWFSYCFVVFRLHSTLNYRFKLTVSMQKLVLKILHWVLRSRPKGLKIWRFGLATRIWHTGWYLRRRSIFFKSHFFAETLGWSWYLRLSLYRRLPSYWHERAAFQRSAFGRSTAGNDVVATIIISIFSFFLFFSPVFFPFFLRRNLFS